MKNFRYDNFADCQQQLDHSVLMTSRGHAVYVQYVSRWKWDIRNMETGKSDIIDIREAGINFAPLELGYVNYQYGLIYAIRKPKRMWKQGLSYDNITTLRGNIGEDFISGVHLNDCLMNKYPTMQEAYEYVLEHLNAKAFHRDFAFTTDDYPEITIEYKGLKVGSLNSNRELEIIEKFHYIKEILEEVIHAEG